MSATQIATVRRFNRLITQRIGVLEESYLRRGRPLSEARLIFETGPDGADLRGLRDRLGLDSGYLSRLLRSLETQGLVRLESDATDRRRRRVQLTAKGRSERAAYDRLSDELANSMLAPLDSVQRDRLLGAMAEIERLIRSAAVDLQVVPPDGAAARQCLAAYFQELAARFEQGFDPEEGGAAADREMTPPRGWFVVARLKGKPAGCGGLRRLDGTSGEIKRMWTAPELRGLGIARHVLRRLEALALDAGIGTLRLDTNRVLAEAQAMYRREGYRDIARYNDNPYAHHWFEKQLGPGTQP